MNAEVAVHKDGQVVRPLKVLVPLIKEDLVQGREAAEQAGLPYYRAAGEKMIEAKPQVSGGFQNWVKRNFGISPSQATRYMAFARATLSKQNETAVPPFTSLKDFARRGRGQDIPTTGGGMRPAPWKSAVDDIAERTRKEQERIREQELTRQEERQAEHTLALRLIEIGYKVLAKELHPDKGGSRDAMSRLNRVRDRLKTHA